MRQQVHNLSGPRTQIHDNTFNVSYSKSILQSNKKAVLLQRWPRDVPYIRVPFMSLHRVGLESTGSSPPHL